MTAPLIETFHFLFLEWSINDLVAAQDAATTVEFEVASAASLLGTDPMGSGRGHDGAVRVDWNYVDALTHGDLARPIFVVTCPSGIGIPHLVADGHHRLALARRQGRRTVPALVFGAEASRRAMTERSLRYVDHLGS